MAVTLHNLIACFKLRSRCCRMEATINSTSFNGKYPGITNPTPPLLNSLWSVPCKLSNIPLLPPSPVSPSPPLHSSCELLHFCTIKSLWWASMTHLSLSLLPPPSLSSSPLIYPLNLLSFLAKLMLCIVFTSFDQFALSWDHLNSKMINSSSLPTILFASLLVLPVIIPARRIDGSSSPSVFDHSKGFDVGTNSGVEVVKQDMNRNGAQGRRPDTVQVAGSSLPDCSHACGSCSPCRLVMVSFVCASLEQAEPCPMAYKCMCNSKSYPVPWPSKLLPPLIPYCVSFCKFY